MTKTVSAASIDVTEIFSSGKLLLCGTAISLLCGQNAVALLFAAAAVSMLRGSGRAASDPTLLLGGWSVLLSLASLLFRLLADEYPGHSESWKALAFALILQKGTGVLLAHRILSEVRAERVLPEDAVRIVAVTVRVLKGRGLVPKDKNWWGRKTTSDPYVVVYHGPNRLGRTSFIKKSLDPDWGEKEAFVLTVVPKVLDADQEFELRILDHDHFSKDDPMGTVRVPVPNHRGPSRERIDWYPVERGRGDSYCHNATGSLLVSVKVRSVLGRQISQELLRSASSRMLEEPTPKNHPNASQ